MIILSLITMITLKGVWFSSYMFIHVNKCCNPFSTNKPFEWLFLWVNTIVFLYFFYFAAFFTFVAWNTLWFLIFFLYYDLFYLSCILYDYQRGDHVLLFPHFPCKTYNEYRHFDSLVFCLYPCFVSVVQIFPHRSQRECLSVHVNFCVGSLLYSRFIITIVTFYCRIGKLLCQLISVLSPIAPIKHIITDLTPGCLVGSVAGHTQNL